MSSCIMCTIYLVTRLSPLLTKEAHISRILPEELPEIGIHREAQNDDQVFIAYVTI